MDFLCIEVVSVRLKKWIDKWRDIMKSLFKFNKELCIVCGVCLFVCID